MKDGEWAKCDGKKIQIVHWPDTESEKDPQLSVTPVQELVCCVEYMGDRTEVWIAVVRHGVEVARHNARMISTIVWLETESS